MWGFDICLGRRLSAILKFSKFKTQIITKKKSHLFGTTFHRKKKLCACVCVCVPKWPIIEHTQACFSKIIREFIFRE